MYTFSPKLKMTAIILMVVGLILFGIGFALNAGNGIDYVKEKMAENPAEFFETSGANPIANKAIGPNTSVNINQVPAGYPFPAPFP